MIGQAQKARILSMQTIPNVDPGLARRLRLPQGHRSIGLFTADSDDVAYTALDEATKKADVRVVYAKSFYAGASNASTALAGEVIGVLSGPDVSEVRAGLDAARALMENEAWFVSAAEDDSVVYYAHCISRSGSYLSGLAGVKEGAPLAYLIAPPMEAMCGLDAALKEADVRMAVFYGPPSETNFAGGLLTGSQSACAAACTAFAREVLRIAARPVE